MSDARETFFINKNGIVAGHYEANMGFAWVTILLARFLAV
jgi:hypothetical protein